MAKDYIKCVAHYGITVKDLNVTRKFYEDVIGLEFDNILVCDDGSDVLDFPAYQAVTGIMGCSFKILNMHGYGASFEFLQYVYPEEIQIDNQPYVRGTSHIAFVVDDPEKAYAELRAKGVPVSSDHAVCIDQGTHTGVYANYFKDPDGLTLEFCKPL